MRLGDCGKTNLHTYSDKEKWSLIRYLDTGSITEGRIDEIQTLYPGVDKIPSRARRKASVGDILFSTVRPNQKHYGIIEAGTENLLVSTGFTVVTVDTTIADPYFIYYYLTQSSVIESLQAIAEQSTSTYPSIKPSDIEDIELDLPELETQKKIGSTLRMLDRKIALNEEINDNLMQQAVTIFKSWFVEYSPFDGIEPKEWETVNLEKITSLISRGIAPKYSDNSDQIVINQKCIRNHMIDLSQARTHTPKVINEKWLRFGDLLINSTGDGTLGRAAQVWFQPQNITVDSHVTVVRPAKENLIFYIGLWGVLHEREIESLHTGSTGQTELPKERVKALELHLPDNGTLDRFNTLIAPMAAAIVSKQNENNKLATLRDALLPKLMSGEIDVSAVQL